MAHSAKPRAGAGQRNGGLGAATRMLPDVVAEPHGCGW